MHIYVCTYEHISTYTSTHEHISFYIVIHIYMYIYMYIYIHIYIYVYTYQDAYTCMYIHILYTCIHPPTRSACGLLNSTRFDSKIEVKQERSKAKSAAKRKRSEAKRKRKRKAKRCAAKRLTKPASSAWADPGFPRVPGGPCPPVRRMERPPYHRGDPP